MRGAGAGVAERERVAVVGGTRAERHPPGQQDRLLEGDLDADRLGQPVLQGGHAARQAPHAVRDLAREAQRLRGQRVEVDRVVVAGDGRVAAAQVAGQRPGGAGGGRVGEDGALRGRGVATAAAQVGRGALPDQLAVAVADLGDEVEDGALGVRARGADVRRDADLLADDHVAVPGHGVGHVHGADGRGREGRVRHHRHVQAEGQHVRVGQRGDVLAREAAQVAVRLDVGALDGDRGPGEGESLEALGAGLAHAGQAADDGQARQGGAQQGAGAGAAVVGAGGALDGGAGHVRRPASSGRRPARRCR